MNRQLLRHWLFWITLATGVVASVISLFYFKGTGFPREGLAQLFIVLALFGHFTFIAFLALLPVLLLSQLIPSRAFFLCLSTIAVSAFLCVLIIDIKVFELYRFHLNSMVWGLFAGGGVGDVFEFSGKDFLLAGLLVILVFIVSGLCVWLAKQLTRLKQGSGKWAWTLTFVMMLSGQTLYAWADVKSYSPVVKLLPMIPWAQPLTVKGFLSKRGWVPESSSLKVKASAKGLLNYPKNNFSCPTPSHKQKNVLFIIVDSLRFDVANDQSVMPNTYHLVNQGSQFLNHYSTGNATRFGIFGLFYGVFGSYWHVMLSENKPPLLIDTLNDQGYEFGVYASGRLTNPEFDKTVFASIREKITLRTKGNNKVERDREVARRFDTFMQERDPDKPFFGLLKFDAAHGYAIPPDAELKFTPSLKNVSYLRLSGSTDREPFLNRYKNSAYFIDSLIAKALATLDESGERDNTIIVFTSDHGQEFNDTKSNAWGHNSNFSEWQAKVPMAIIYPDKAASTYTHLSSHVDVAPTLLRDLVGCEGDYSLYSQGWPLDHRKDHKLLMLSSWSKFALYDGNKTEVLYGSGIKQVHDANYQVLAEEQPSHKNLLRAIKLNSEFLK